MTLQNHTGSFASAALAALSCTAFAANVVWTSGSGDWSEADKWDGGAVPTASDVAEIPDQPSGIRTIVVDQAAEAQGLTITQTIPAGATAFQLDADFQLSPVAWDSFPLSINPGSVTSSVSFNLNGHTFTVKDIEGHRMNTVLGGTWNVGPGSMLSTIETGNQSAMQLINNGVLNLHDGGIVRYAFDVGGHNNGGARIYVNNGVWTQTNGSIFEFWTPGYAVGTGGYGYLYGCENNGTMSILGGSTNHFGLLTNNGELLIGDDAHLGHYGAAPVFDTGAEGVTTVAGTNAVLWTDNGNASSTLHNHGRFVVGNGVATNDFTVRGGSAYFYNDAGEFIVSTNSTLALQYRGAQGNCVIENSGLLRIDGGVMQTDWISGDPNVGHRYFSNAGDWRVENGGRFWMTSTIGMDVWGFADNYNSGHITVDNATFQFVGIHNNGTITLGDNANFGGNRTSNYWLIDNTSGTVEVTGTNAVFGSLELANTGFNLTLSSQGVVDHQEFVTNWTDEAEGEYSSIDTNDIVLVDSVVRVGADDGTPASFFLASPQNVTYTTGANATTIVCRAASMTLSARCANRTTKGSTEFTNGGWLRQGGDIMLQPNFNGNRNFHNRGTWVVDSGDDNVALLGHLWATGGQNMDSIFFNNYAGASFGGCGAVAYTNESSNPNCRTLTFSNNGDIRPSGGLLTVSNFVVTCASGSSLTIDAATPGTCGRLALAGEGATYALPASGATLDIQLPEKLTSTWGGHHTIRIVEAEGGVSGAFDSITINGADPALSDAICTVEYGATYIDLTVAVPSGSLILIR